MKTKAHIFKTFPEFSKLTLADHEKWDSLICNYPPITQFSFAGLQCWWNTLDTLRVAQLNNNIVISYWFPGDPDRSGLGLIGTQNVDESICEIFDWQKEKGEPPKLVHVPEFTIECIKYPDMYRFSDERSDDECVINIGRFSEVDRLSGYKKSKLASLLKSADKLNVYTQPIDIGDAHVQEELRDIIKIWGKDGFNGVGLVEQENLYTALASPEDLGINCLALMVGGSIEAFILYQYHHDPKYILVNFARFNYSIPHIFELAVFKFSQMLVQEGIKFANIECDLGMPQLRSPKLFLGPTNFFRKYTITPKSKSA